MDTDVAVTDPVLHPKYVDGEKLGAEITELCGYLYAGTYRLLALIREFDEKGAGSSPASPPAPTGSTSSAASA